MSNWKWLAIEKPIKEGWYLTKRSEYDSPSVTVFIPDHDGFGLMSRVVLWCDIPE